MGGHLLAIFHLSLLLGKTAIGESTRFSFSDFIEEPARPELRCRIVFIEYDSARFKPVKTPVGSMRHNIFQSDNPIAMMKAVRGVVHEGLTPEKGFQMYQDLKGK